MAGVAPLADTQASVQNSSPTPILDRVLPVPPSSYGGSARFKRLLLGLLFGFLGGIGITIAQHSFFPASVNAYLVHIFRGLPLVQLLPLVFFWNYVAIFLHEMGHVVAGLGSGLRFNYVGFGPLLVSGDFKVSLKWGRKNIAKALTSMIPKETDFLRWRYLGMILGGPFANLLTAVGVVAFQKLTGNSSPILGTLAWISVILGMANLIPFRAGAALSDGKRAWMLMFQGRKAERWLAIIQLYSDLSNGRPPVDLDKGLLEKATQVIDRSLDTVSGHALAYSAAFDSRNDEDAASLLETCLRYCRYTAPAAREGLFVAAAVFQARRRKAAALAREWLAIVPEKTQTPGLRLQGEAALLECDGRISEAVAKLDESETAARSIPQPAQREITLRSLERWKAELVPNVTSAAVEA